MRQLGDVFQHQGHLMSKMADGIGQQQRKIEEIARVLAENKKKEEAKEVESIQRKKTRRRTQKKRRMDPEFSPGEGVSKEAEGSSTYDPDYLSPGVEKFSRGGRKRLSNRRKNVPSDG